MTTRKKTTLKRPVNTSARHAKTLIKRSAEARDRVNKARVDSLIDMVRRDVTEIIGAGHDFHVDVVNDTLKPADAGPDKHMASTGDMTGWRRVSADYADELIAKAKQVDESAATAKAEMPRFEYAKPVSLGAEHLIRAAGLGDSAGQLYGDSPLHRLRTAGLGGITGSAASSFGSAGGMTMRAAAAAQAESASVRPSEVTGRIVAELERLGTDENRRRALTAAGVLLGINGVPF